MHNQFSTLLLEEKDKNILTITLNRPQFRNAINHQMMQELQRFWQEIAADPEHFRCIILTGSAPAFCAGADLKERFNLSLEVWQQQHIALEQAMLAIIDCPIPIIAAVNGAAYGGGLELALASDFIYAAKNAIFSQSETKIGIIPGAMGTQNLPRAVGIRRAKELCFTALPFSAEQAYQWGIVNKICEQNELMTEVITVANIICENAPLAVQQAKKALNMSQQLDIKSGFAFELEAYNSLLSTADRVEGINAFNEKRKPKFIGK